MLITDYILLFVLVLSVLSLLYSIRSLTSRNTSGKSAGNPIIPSMKQWISILFGRPKKWQSQPQDAIDTYNTVYESSNKIKSRAHYDFFIKKFNTYDPESLANLRLLELRAVNYSKAYAENIASKLLFYAIVLLIVWLFCPYIFYMMKECYEWGRSIIHSCKNA